MRHCPPRASRSATARRSRTCSTSMTGRGGRPGERDRARVLLVTLELAIRSADEARGHRERGRISGTGSARSRSGAVRLYDLRMSDRLLVQAPGPEPLQVGVPVWAQLRLLDQGEAASGLARHPGRSCSGRRRRGNACWAPARGGLVAFRCGWAGARVNQPDQSFRLRSMIKTRSVLGHGFLVVSPWRAEA